MSNLYKLIVKLTSRFFTPQALKFIFVGISGIFVNQFFLYFLHETNFFLSLPVASILAIELSILNNFTWNNIWTFKGRKKGLIRKISRFHISSSIGAVVNFVILLSLSSIGFNIYFSNLIGIFLSFLIRFSLSEFWVWNDDESNNS